ncbi:uncharacterized protein F4822DRAFT_420185 [Hypoxylon trugodes]|uniref:uncharacterized protein n=1 Tax=Hypoxylon trugodes TaxID=326681 RepID=UPI002193FA4A|nr:uncharacterized protein F4822DRAFT_420185 [Hypoxylon trugodes]KAI1383317.1 hypothetical protein F4822DRAFT_420185 [Hypoxylon trugodes]
MAAESHHSQNPVPSDSSKTLSLQGSPRSNDGDPELDQGEKSSQQEYNPPQGDASASTGNTGDTEVPPNVLPRSPEEIRNLAQPRVTRILKNQRVLNMIIGQHEEIIQKRWKNKSKSKRKALLLEAWPNMPPMHRPEVALWRRLHNEYSPHTQADAEDLTPFWWPHINLEDLCKTEPLLLMLNGRGTNPPDTFVYADYGSSSFAVRTNLIKAVYLPRHSMLFRGRITEETYGQLYYWDDDDEAMKTDPTRAMINPSIGLWILEIQDRLYDFLVKCCTLILHDMPNDVLVPVTGVMRIRPELPILSAKISSESVESLAISAFEDLFKAPRDTDFDRIEALLRAQKASAEDHLFALKEDPDAEGKTHPVFDESELDFLWARIWRLVMIEAFSAIDIPTVLLDKLLHLIHLLDEHEVDMSPEKELPLGLGAAVYDFMHTLLRSAWTFSDMGTFHKFSSSPPMRQYYCRDQQGKITSRLDSCPIDKARDDLINIVENLGSKQQLFVLGARGLVTELDFLVRREPATRSLLTDLVADRVSTIGVLCECIHQLDLFQPWMSAYSKYYDQHTADLTTGVTNSLKYMYNFHKLDDRSWKEMAAFIGVASSGTLPWYPSKARPIQEVIETRKVIEHLTDKFWEGILPELKKVDGISPAVLHAFNRNVNRTKLWVAPSETPKKGKKGESVLDEFDKLMLEVREENEKVKRRIKSKAKGKSTKKATEETEAEAEGEATLAPPPPPPTPLFKVDKRAMKVFNAILYDQPDTSQLGDVTWNDFVYAMIAVGFKAEKMFGSGWHFEPPLDWDIKETILLNEPQSGKLGFVVMRLYGRRLARTYGWERHTFALAT